VASEPPEQDEETRWVSAVERCLSASASGRRLTLIELGFALKNMGFAQSKKSGGLKTRLRSHADRFRVEGAPARRQPGSYDPVSQVAARR
jgi:hypothetical protein